MKILTIIGTRPQFIKASIISNEFTKYDFINEIILHTGQHYEKNMSTVFFKELNIPKPNYYLGINKSTHGIMTGKMIIKIEEIILKESPDLIIVYGDTNTTLAGAIAASKLRVKIVHVEAGLRSYNKDMPEEINRILTDHVSDLLFCPTASSVENLKKEGIYDGVYLVGDVMYDIALKMSHEIDDDFVLNKYNLNSKNYILVTIHRAENTEREDRFLNIWKSLDILGKMGYNIIFPLHPRTKNLIKRMNLKIENFLNIIPPLSYKEMLSIERNAKLIITDSGGVQKEAYFWKVPCLILRNETEWIELLEYGLHCLCKVEKETIVKKALKQMENYANFDIKMIFSEGAPERIVKNIIAYYDCGLR